MFKINTSNLLECINNRNGFARLITESISTSSLGGWSTTAEAALESVIIPQQAQQAAPPPWSPALEVREFDELHSATIPAYQFWSSEFRNKQPAYVSLNFTVPWGANFAVYGRRNVAPSVTQYDFVEFIRGGRVDHRLRRRRSSFSDNPFQSSRNDWDALLSTINPLQRWNHTISKRSTDMRVNVSILQYLDTGRWFISVYNDELQPHNVEMIVSEAEGVTNSCPDDCSGHGSCYLGKCECMDGYEGHDCSKSKYKIFIIRVFIILINVFVSNNLQLFSQVYAQFFVRGTARMQVVYVTVRKGGKARNVTFQHTTVSRRTVPEEVNVSPAIAIVNLDGKDRSAMKVKLHNQDNLFNM